MQNGEILYGGPSAFYFVLSQMIRRDRHVVIREAAIAYGASKWYLLRKVDLPLATPSILAGVNQTVMLSLAMVVVASLIGAKGLGQDVLEALQYANVGQGILAGVAILFVALILDRVVQGKKRV